MSGKVKRVPAGKRLLDEGWFSDEKEALAWVMARKVFAYETPIQTLSEKIPQDAVIRVKEYYKKKYVNKGGLKLSGALSDFHIKVNGMTALDCGASTGGFTDCLLQSGASLVYAVDVGFGQLEGKLLCDERVVNLERTNLEDERLLHLEPRPELITLDLSYLSLKKAIPICRAILGERGRVLCLVKPLFEVEACEVRRSGKLDDREELHAILLELCTHFASAGNTVLGVTHSHVTGNKGTLEYFLYLSFRAEDRALACAYEQQAEAAVAASLQLARFDKNNYQP